MSGLLPLFVLATVLGAPVTAAQVERPNIILFVTDDQRDDFLGCAGHPVLRTPVIDGLAADGVRFENAFVTTPICAASRASIFTGAWERRHGYTFGTPPLAADLVERSYPAVLRKAGYRTGFIGKFGVRAGSEAPGVMFDFYRPQWTPYLKEGPDGTVRHLTDVAGDLAIEFLEGCEADRPFCLSVSFNAPHAADADKVNHYPFSPPEAELYAEAEIRPPRVSTDFWSGLPEFLSRSMHRRRWFWRWDTREKYERNVRAYYRMISGIDRVIGQVLAEVERLGLADDTVVIFTGDNGYYKGSRGFAGKWSHYEESLRVPLVIHDPRLDERQRGRVARELALNVDLAATIVDLAGLETPSTCQGRSLAPIVRGEPVEGWREDFFCEHLLDNALIPRWEGVRGERYVYARYLDNMPEGEFLHDLARDPLQLVNVARDPAHRETLRAMRERCDELGTATGRAPALTPVLSEERFKDPPLSARPMVLWPWLNGHVDRAQITHELEEMKAKGLRGPIIWDIGSLADPEQTIPVGPAFLEAESLRSIHHALDEASRLGLDVGLVASSSWNAGGSWIGPEHASKQLRWAEREVTGPASLSERPPEPEGLAPPITEVALLAISRGQPSDPASDALDLSGRVDEEGRLHWEVPPGDWTILRFVCSGTGQPLVCPSPASNGLVVDHLSAAAIDRHFEVMLERLYRGREALPALELLMLDSFEVWQRPDWTPGFAEEFRRAYGYDPLPYLPLLAGRSTPDPEVGERFLHDYRALVSRMMTENHFGRAATILGRRGIDLLAEAGHGGAPRVGPLEALGVSQIPMGEFWNGKQFWVTKEAASAAHIYGRRDVAAEALTGWRHWRDGPDEYKRLFDLAFCAGLNRPVFHTFAHNPPEAGKPGFAYHAGEHFNVNSTWWEQSGPMLTYLSRCSHLLRQGRFVADVCFYYGDQAPNLVPSRRIDPKVAPPHDPDECQHCGRKKPNRVESLGPGYDFDYVNRDVVVNDLEVRDGRLTLSSGMEYRLIALPDREDIALPVLRWLEELVREGATLVGRPPTRSNSLAGYPGCDEEVRRLSRLLFGEGPPAGGRRHGQGRVLGDVPLREVLRELGVPPDFTVESPASHELDYIHRRTAREEIYFVINGADEPVLAECSFRVAPGWRPFLWDPEDGSVTPCLVYRVEGDRIRVPLALPQVSSVFVVFRAGDGEDHIVDLGRPGRAAPSLIAPGVEVMSLDSAHVRLRAREPGVIALATASGRTQAVGIPAPPTDLEAPGPWKLEFPEGCGAPASLELDELISWTELEPEGARFFSGTARYTTTVSVPESYLHDGLALELDLGTVEEIAEVRLNGEPLDALWHAPYRADVTGRLRVGANRLEVAVTNLWRNRIVGDLRSPEAGVHARTNLKSKFRANMELLPSGLLGPVVVRAAVLGGAPLR